MAGAHGTGSPPMGHRFRRPGARNSDRSDETVGPRRSVRRGTTERDGVHHGDGGRSTCHALRAGRKYRRSMYTPTTARIVPQAKSGPNKSKSAYARNDVANTARIMRPMSTSR